MQEAGETSNLPRQKRQKKKEKKGKDKKKYYGGRVPEKLEVWRTQQGGWGLSIIRMPNRSRDQNDGKGEV